MALPEDLHSKWGEAEETGDPIPIGQVVVCDGCDRDFTRSDESGGFIFGSYGYGPCCADRMMQTIRRYAEEHLIRAHCPEGVSFADFIRQYRGPDAAIQIKTGPKK